MQRQQAPRCPKVVHCGRPLLGRLPFARIADSYGAQPAPATITNFSGTWVKDKGRSDSMEPAIQMIGLGGLMRTAIKLIRGVQITQDDTTFTFAVFSVFSWFKVKEVYNMDGSEIKGRRRDFRRGGFLGSLQPVAGGQQVQLSLQWQEPFGGSCTDTFSMPHRDELHVRTEMTTGAGSVGYTSVFNRNR